MKPINLTWDFDNFIHSKDTEYVKEELQAQSLIGPQEFVKIARYPVQITAERAPKDLKYLKKIGDFHIWTRGQGKKYLVFNLDPFLEIRQLEIAQQIADQENANIILY